MKRSIINLKDVWKVYKLGNVDVPALRGLSLDIKEGEFVAVQGASGSGKSTALNSIGCLDIPTRGTVYLDNNDISKLDESTLAQLRGKKIGFIFQTFNLIPSLNAMENVMLPMMFQGVSKNKREERAKQLLGIVGLSHRLNHKPAQLSGGEQQRIAIARALANDPDVILADEPTGNLDSKNGKEIMELLRSLHEKQHKTIVMVTHDDNLARYADRIIHMSDGRVGS